MNKTDQKQVKPREMKKSHGVYPIVNTRKTQRNDFCPCGSGKKFKKCCLS